MDYSGHKDNNNELIQCIRKFCTAGHPVFFLGMIVVLVKSDLEIPPQIAKFLSIYLLFDIGIKGGEELFHSGFNGQVFTVMVVCILSSFSIPFVMYYILKRKLNVYDAGAIAATYGSISVVRFASTSAFPES